MARSILRRRHLQRVPGVLVVSLGLSVAGAPPALAVTTCGFSAGVVTATMASDGDSAAFVVSGGAILMNGVACGAATVSNTDSILATTDNVSEYDDNIVSISHVGGRFEPGATVEGGSGLSEIEWQINLGEGDDEVRFIGTPGIDVVTLGAGGGTPAMNLNASESPGDADVQFLGTGYSVESPKVYGNDGADVLSSNGGSGTGAAYAGGEASFGGSGADTLTGGSGRDHIIGGIGPDTIVGGGSHDQLFGGAGDDDLFGDQGDDALYGNAGADELHGGAGADVIVGGAGFDKLYGETGADDLNAQDGAHDIVSGGPHPPQGDVCAVGPTDTVTGCEHDHGHG
jgi:Ca2+-binding RTX toxin-like protein